ncbi:ATP-binding protein [Legionella gresilensis]|uniref:ATP-binding protein n=1 Tax=Legionella gresilensis TaxID=91823 RepID=UPI00104129C4|nr:ATP-binding protein [Legionella gresilensis]
MDKYILLNLINHLPHAIFWKDCNLVFQGCNRIFAKKLGFSEPQDIIGKTDFDLLPAEAAVKYRRDDKMVIESGRAKLDYEETFIQPNGKKRTVLVSKVPFYDDKKVIVGILGIYTDITQRKKQEEQLKKAKKNSEAANRAKDEFIRNMSHDIRTPLSGIIGMSSLLEQEAHTPEDREHAHMLNISSEQLLILLNSVLDIVATGSAIEADTKLSKFNIYELIQYICDLELPAIKIKNLDLKINIEKEVPKFIQTDQIKLHRILLNLLGNAVKFTNKGCIEIIVRLENKSGNKTNLEFLIKDTGIGIKPEDKQKIFTRFYRANPSAQGIYSGYGVGLHIVKKYTKLLKGRIAVESNVGQGTTFCVTIPVQVVANKNDLTKNDEAQYITTVVNTSVWLKNGDKPCILIVEDNAIALKTAETILKQAHCQFQSAQNGARAIELFREYKFDLILLDIGLPDIYGNELTKIFRRIEQEENKIATPIIGLTAYSPANTEAMLLKAGMNKVITKPFRLAALNELLAIFVKDKVLTTDDIANQADLANLFSEVTQYPLIDVEQGINTIGSINALTELLQMLLSETPDHLKELEQAWDKENIVLMSRIIHKMKGGALCCGAAQMQHACHVFEQNLNSSTAEELAKLLEQFILIVKRTLIEIESWLAKNNPTL